jgi:hypothetical protein
MVSVVVLAGCGLDHFAAKIATESVRSIACQCPQDQAVTYAMRAAMDLGVTPVFQHPTRFNVTLSNPDRLTVTKFDVTIKATGTATSVVRVRAESASAESTMGERALNAFAEAFAKVVQ